ncbi:MAG: phospholipase D family protein [Nitrospinae bacterium]|nr:phospholipase D family protein [Nitrospinota bacterium]
MAISTADFKSMLVPTGERGKADSIVSIFYELAFDGVEIRLLHSGVPSLPALHEMKEPLPKNFIIRRCPRLHSKTVIIDACKMYLGSANLTGAGLGAKGKERRNFEAGLWTESTALIDAVEEKFNALWEGVHCDPCGRKNICPVPLEEPDISSL